MKLTGLVLVQNRLPLLVRCLDSLIMCDEIVIVDGGSTDGSYEWLQQVKGLYNLRIYKNKFEDMTKQRNFGLSKIKDSWVINIDTDEELNYHARFGLALYIKRIGQNLYDLARKEKKVLCIDLPHINLIHDYFHYSYPWNIIREKVFYKDSGVKMIGGYHSEPVYVEENKSQYINPPMPERMAIFHYALLMTDKKEREKRLKKANEVWESSYWYGEHDVRILDPKFI